MTIEIRVPALGESVTEATVARWFKAQGDAVAVDEPLVELETDKVALEVNAPAAGVLGAIDAEEGAEVEVGALLGKINEGEAAAASAAPAAAPAKAEAAAPAPAAAAAPAEAAAAGAGPAARKLMAEAGLDAGAVAATGPKGHVTKGDVLAAVQSGAAAPAPAPVEAPAPSPAPAPEGRETRVKMTRLRRRIAERLKEAQNTAAMLTTWNEADMSEVMALRKRHQDAFVKKHGVKLGFMSIFVKAAIEALRAFPAVNGEIDGDEIVYKHYYDIGVAVGTETGLVVPVVRDADARGFADIEKEIADLGMRAREGKLAMTELQGGTFTISNGGIYGSLMSSPILNPPQVGILGMHKIQERPVVLGGQVVVRPMMYLALSYDHRIVDGREAVSFLVRIKECLEDPSRMLVDA